jgi:hypothetical protein
MKNKNIFQISNIFKRKIFKYDFKSGKIIQKEIYVQEFFKNKKVLMIYPYPSKERLNSELYDDILNKMKFARELDHQNHNKKTNTKINNDIPEAPEAPEAPGAENKKEKERKDKNHKLEKFEIFKTKYLNDLDEIVGLSQLNDKKTEEYLSKSKIPDIWFIVDESNSINDQNKFENRYEVLIDNMQIASYKPDPNLSQNIVVGSSILYLLILMGTFNLIVYLSVLKTNKENEGLYKKISDSLY